MNILQRFGKDILRAIGKEKYQVSPEGILLFGGSLKLAGCYEEGVRGQPGSYRRSKNLIPTEGLNTAVDILFGDLAKISAWYLAPFSGSGTPAAGWNASNFASNASEITSTTEGYTEVTRQQCVFSTTPSSGTLDNYAAKTAMTIATASTLVVKGLGLLSVSTRGGTTGVLGSVTKFTVDRTLVNGDVWEAGYRIVAADA